MKLGKEEKVGLLVIMSLISLVYLTFKIGDFSLKRKKGLELYADFVGVNGLEKGAQVRVAGVEAGKVENITLRDGRPRLTMSIFPGIKIRQNAMATIQSQGFMGEKFVELTPGTSDAPYLENGDLVQVSEEYVDFDKLSQRISLVVEDFKAITGALKETLASAEGKMSLQKILVNLQESTFLLKDLFDNNRRNIEQIVTNFQGFSSNINALLMENQKNISLIIADLQSFTQSLREETPEFVQQLQSTAQSLDALLADNRLVVQKGIQNANQLIIKLQGTADHLNGILSSVNQGEGTIGKLFKDDSLYNEAKETIGGIKTVFEATESFQLILGFRNEFFTRFEKSKSYFSLTLQPRRDKYYLLELVDDFRGVTTTKETKISEDTGATNTIREEITIDDFTFTLQIAKRFDNTILRGGLIESKGGVGLDYFLMKDSIQLHLNASDFTVDDPHLKFGIDYRFGKYFLVNTGVDQLVNDDRRSYFFGAGFYFEDEDLKYLLGKIPIPGL